MLLFINNPFGISPAEKERGERERERGVRFVFVRFC